MHSRLYSAHEHFFTLLIEILSCPADIRGLLQSWGDNKNVLMDPYVPGKSDTSLRYMPFTQEVRV